MPNVPPAFRPPSQPRTADSRKAADRRRGSARARGYSAHWDRTSRGFLAAHPLCLCCQTVGVIRPARVTDHTVPHHGDMARFWDPANWQPGCEPCHDVIKARLEAMWERGEIRADQLCFDSETAQQLRRALGAL
jgi:5-methylcytosine-specific restriction endonuclease McrA